MNKPMVELYDTSLRDGTQAEDVSFTVEDKLLIAERLDDLGIHYIEGGWPGSNPKDEEFFKRAKKLRFKNSKMAAFGSTRRHGIAASKDKNLKSLIAAETPIITIFGKSWDFHTHAALHISLEENLDLIGDSVAYLKGHVEEVIYDAEHFFDGYKANPDYALQSIQRAFDAGAHRIVLCDTNGGTLPSEVSGIIAAVQARLSAPLGIHGHNDAELAVANSLAAIQAGAIQIHGTINGFGERCGNANLVSIIPTLKLKMGIDCVTDAQLKKLRDVSRFVDELSNRTPSSHQPYVGDSAFAHKGGIHVSAILKDRKTYEHTDPEAVGNHQRILVSDLAGQSTILFKAKEFGLDLDRKDPSVQKIVKNLKELENQGYQFEGAEASFELLMKKALKKYKPAFKLIQFQVIDGKASSGTMPHSEAQLQIEVGGRKEKVSSRGVGPVDALDQALRKALQRFYPQIRDVELVDYKVRVLPSGQGTSSQVRVLIESKDKTGQWGTVGVSENIIEASWQALVDSLEYKLLRDNE